MTKIHWATVTNTVSSKDPNASLGQTDGPFTAWATAGAAYNAGAITLNSPNPGPGAVIEPPDLPLAGAQAHWVDPVSDNFNIAVHWSTGRIPGASDSAILDARGKRAYTVTASTSETVKSIQLAATATLAITGGTFTARSGTGAGKNAGAITVDNGAGFTAGGTFANATTGVIEADGAASHFDLRSATISGGTLKTSNGGVIDTVDGGSVLDGTKAAVNNAGDLVVNDNTALTIQGSINNTDSIDLNGAAKGDSVAVGAAGATLSGGGQVTLTDNSANIIDGAAAGDTLTNVDNTISGAGDIGDGQMTLINQAAGVIDATGTNALILDTGAATVTNIGLIETANTGGLTIDSAINNTGVIMADIGALTVKGAVSGSGSAVVDNAKLDFASTFNENVTFTGPGGALELAQSTAYAGTITGFTNNFDSSLALDDIAFTSGVTKATYIDNGMATGGVLTVTDGTHTAHITLVGNYAADIFTVGADGTGGTTVMAGPRPPFHWAQAINGDFNTAPDWTGGAVPGPADNAILDPTGAAFTVTASTSESVNSIQLAANATLAITGGAFTASAGTGSGANAGLISVDDHTALDVGGAIANSGTIKVLGGGFYNSDLNVLAGGATLTGAGQVYLASRSFIYTAPGATLTNFDNTISGIGGIEAASGGSLNLINDAKGAIDGSGGSALTLNSGTGTITNDGLIEATGTAGVIISGGVIDGSGGGSILAANGGVVTLSGGSVVGGTLTTAGSGVILSDNGSLDGTHAAVHNTGALNIPNHQALAINGTIANAGTIGVLGGGFYDAYLVINAAGATLTGGGQVYLGGRGDIQSAAAGDTLTNFDNTISGAGVVGSLSGGSLTLINAAKGVIDGDTGLALRLASGTGTITNDGLIEATSAAGIVLLNGVIDGSGGGAILAANGGTVTLGGAVVAGGTLSAAGSGVLQATGGTLDGTNAAVHLAADLTIADRGGLTIEGTIDNAASIVLPGGGYGSVLATGAGGATLTGGGQVIISGGRSYIRSDAAGDTLTNFNNTISGAGTLGSYRGGFLNLVNDAAGVIEGDSASVLNLNPVTGTITNDGLIEGASRAGIRLSSGVIDGSGGGTILAADGGHVYLSGADIVGGTLSTAGSGAIVALYGKLDGTGAAVHLTGLLAIGFDGGGRYPQIDGTIANTGTFGMYGNGGDYAKLSIGAAGATLTGGGQILGGDSDYIQAVAGGATLTNDGNTISADGNFFLGPLTLVNKAGTIDANGRTGLILPTTGGTFTNGGVLESTGTGGLAIQNATVNQSTGGQIYAGNGSVVTLASVDDIGGAFNTAGTGTIVTTDSGSILDGSASAVSNKGTFDIANGDTLTARGAIANSGTIALASAGTATDLVFDRNTTLTGGGTVSLSANAMNYVKGTKGSIVLTNAANTIAGSGQLGDGRLTLINGAAGVIDANGTPLLVINTGANTITNAGLIETTGGACDVKSAVANTGTIEADGGTLTLDAAVSGSGAVTIAAGTLDIANVGAMENVAFTGKTGKLELEQSQSYGGSVTGFSLTTKTSLDLRDITYDGTTTESYSGTATSGTLTVTHGTAVANIHLNGDYLSSTFTLSSDGHGGTTVVDPPNGDAASSPPPHAFIAAMAGLGAGAAGPVHAAAEVWRGPPAMLAGPRTVMA